jgi:hypothetical protein
LILFQFVFGKGQQVVVGVGDREFGGAVEGFLETVDNIDVGFYAVEEGADVLDPDIEEQGAAVLAADHGQGVAEALEGLEHKGDLAAADHGPDEVVVGFSGDGHDEVEAEGLLEFDGGADVFYEEIGS